MCLHKKFLVPYKRAKKDLYTFKYLDDNLYSPYMTFRYELNRLYKLETKTFWNVFSRIVNEGFHSVYGNYPCLSHVTFLCKIPKGSKYYLGSDGDVVSDQIEIVEKIERSQEDRKVYGIKDFALDYLKKHYPNNLINE